MFIINNKTVLCTYLIKIVNQSENPRPTAFTFSFVSAIFFADFSINARTATAVLKMARFVLLKLGK